MKSWIGKIAAPRQIWWRALLLMACLMGLLHSQSKIYSLDVSMGAKLPPKSVAQVFYSYGGLVFPDTNNQVMLTYKQADGEITYEARLRTTRPIRLLRLDVSNLAGEIHWSSLKVLGKSGSIEVRGKDLPSVARSYNQLQIVSSGDAGQQMTASGIDPQVLIDIPIEMTQLPASAQRTHWLSVFGWSLLWVGLFECMLRLVRPENRVNIRVKHFLTRVAEHCSEDATIRFRPASLMVYAVLVSLAFICVALKLNQSSVGMWDQLYPAEFVERDISLGTPKGIRSDEWHTMTPWVLSQVQSGMQSDNVNLGAPSSAMLAGAPQMGWMMLAQPKYWGFVFLDMERGFSWIWAAKAFGLIAAFFTLLLMFTKGEVVISMAGALGVWGSSYVQWWLSSVPAEVISGFSAAVVGSVYLLVARKVGGLVFGAVLVAFAVPNLLLHLYPPYLQPLAYLSLFLLLGVIGSRHGLILFRQRLGLRLFTAACTVAVTGALVWWWYLQVADAIQLMLNTDYPGHRISAGGDLPLHRLFYGVFESWKIKDNDMPFPPVNPSEASSFWILFPFSLLLVAPGEWRKPAMRPALGMLLFCLLTLAWTSLPIPALARNLLASLGWYLTPATRGDFALAVGSALLMATVVGLIARGDVHRSRLPSPVLALFVVLAVGVYGVSLQLRDPIFFNWPRIGLATAAVSALMWAAHRGLRWWYLALTIFAAVPTLHVNPVQSGLGPFLQKGILQKAKSVGGETENLWAVFGSTEVAQGFKAVGLHVINGTHYAPRMAWIDTLDPSHRYQQVWNRYAHIDLERGEPDAPPVYKIDFADSYTIKVDVCSPKLSAIGVTHAAFAYSPSETEMRCLHPLLTGDHSGVSLYRIARPQSASQN